MIDVLMAAVIAMAHPQAPADTTVVTVAEDDPAFDCRTMGNLRCGIGAVLPDGSLAVPVTTPTRTAGLARSINPSPPAGTPIDTTVIEEP